MSRFDNDYDEEPFPNAAELWHANTQRALSGKRGKKALAELREALLALPEKRLIEGALCTVGVKDDTAFETANPQYLDPNRNWWREDVERNLTVNGGEGVCAIGAYLWHKKVQAGMAPDEAFAALPRLFDFDGGNDWETAQEAKGAGMTFTLAYHLAYKNDGAFESMTPEARYVAFMVWLDAELGAIAA